MKVLMPLLIGIICLPQNSFTPSEKETQLVSFLDQNLKNDVDSINNQSIWYYERWTFSVNFQFVTDWSVGMHTAMSINSHAQYLLYQWYLGQDYNPIEKAKLIYCDGKAVYDLDVERTSDLEGNENAVFSRRKNSLSNFSEVFIYAQRWCEYVSRYGIHKSREVCYSPLHPNYQWEVLETEEFSKTKIGKIIGDVSN